MLNGVASGVVLRGCPRCGGALAMDMDSWGRRWRCLFCAREVRPGQVPASSVAPRPLWEYLFGGDTVARRVPRE